MAANYRFQLKRPSYLKGITSLAPKLLEAISKAAIAGVSQADDQEEACSQAIAAKANEIKEAKHRFFKDIEVLPREPHKPVKPRIKRHRFGSMIEGQGSPAIKFPEIT